MSINSYLCKCRLCFGAFKSGDKHVHITKVIEERFEGITQMQVS